MQYLYLNKNKLHSMMFVLYKDIVDIHVHYIIPNDSKRHKYTNQILTMIKKHYFIVKYKISIYDILFKKNRKGIFEIITIEMKTK